MRDKSTIIDDHQRSSKKVKLDELFSTCDGYDKTSKLRKSHLYQDKLILAPMVRANSLPFRLLCLRHGADLVYSEELIDHRVTTCKRVENHLLGTIDFVDKDGRVIFRTCEEEKDRVIFQLGSNDPERALQAAKLVSQDVMGLDFNFGCPKKFSIAGGMGAALLEQPDKIKTLLTTCVRELEIPVTCKIRLLPSLEATLNLVKLIESCGVSAIAVHGRTKDQRPAHDNDIATLKAISEVLTIPLIANGESNNLKTYQDVMKFRQQTNASSVMIARAAMRNPRIFNPRIQSFDKTQQQSNTIDRNSKGETEFVSSNGGNTIIEEYVKLAVRYDNHPSNVKYSLQSLMSNAANRPSKEFSVKFHRATSLSAIADLFRVSNQTSAPTSVATITGGSAMTSASSSCNSEQL